MPCPHLSRGSKKHEGELASVRKHTRLELEKHLSQKEKETGRTRASHRDRVEKELAAREKQV